MPNKDGTGPKGQSPKTGKQLGNCKDAKPKNGFGEDCNRPGRCQRN